MSQGEQPWVLDSDVAHFDEDVLQASAQGLVLVDLWADWCAPCRRLAPVLDKVVRSYQGQVRLVKIDVDEGLNMKIAGRYQAKGFPTVLLIKHGQEVARFHSAQPEHVVREMVDRWVG